MARLKYLNYRVEGDNKHSSFVTTGHKGNGIYFIKFDDGWESSACSAQLRSGKMKSPYYPKVCGVGFMGDGSYSYINKKIYNVWCHMLERCYDPDYKEYHLYGGKGVEVCEEWHNFQNFARWYEKHEIVDFALDKDLVGNGFTYSPDHCILLPSVINSFITNSSGRKGGNLYTGVYVSCEKYKSQCCQLDGKVKYLGSYSTPEKAYLVYEKEKIRLAKELADKYRSVLDTRIIYYLDNFSDHIKDLTVNPYNTKGE